MGPLFLYLWYILCSITIIFLYSLKHRVLKIANKSESGAAPRRGTCVCITNGRLASFRFGTVQCEQAGWRQVRSRPANGSLSSHLGGLWCHYETSTRKSASCMMGSAKTGLIATWSNTFSTNKWKKYKLVLYFLWSGVSGAQNLWRLANHQTAGACSRFEQSPGTSSRTAWLVRNLALSGSAGIKLAP